MYEEKSAKQNTNEKRKKASYSTPLGLLLQYHRPTRSTPIQKTANRTK